MSASSRAVPSLLLSSILAACSAGPPAEVAAPCPSGRPSGAPASSASVSASASAGPAGAGAPALPTSWVALFDGLADRIEAHHQFADAVKAAWPARRALLRKEFDAVTTREEALVALAHAQAALGDRHCWLSPPTDLRRQRLSLGLRLFAETGGAVRVDRVLAKDLADRVAEGDEVVAVDGTPIQAFLASHPLESNSLNSAVARAETARAISDATLPWSRVKPGDERTLRLRRAGAERDVALRFRRPSDWEDQDKELDFDDAPAMAAVGCRDDKEPPYAAFELQTVGTNLCVYRPKDGRKNTRLVRWVSFRYQGEDGTDALRAARADHDLLARELRGAGAVILDVHENHGGNNPFVFLSFFAQKPWDHQQIQIHVSPAFSEDEVRQFLFGSPTYTARYRAAAAAGKREDSWPFLCNRDGKPVVDGTCEAVGPRPSELVTKAPVAIVTGPECTSSCDSLVADWAAFRMGPVVGQQPAHGFTSVRHSFPLVGPDGRDLGSFRIALSREGYPRAGRMLEGAPIDLDWEAPSTFETRRTWVDLAVAEARRRVEQR